MGYIHEQQTTEHPEQYPDLTRSEVLTLGKLASNEIVPDCLVSVSKSQLAKQRGLSVKGLSKHLKKLELCGYITKIQNQPDPARPNLYQRNSYILRLVDHPASCTNRRHGQASGGAESKGYPGNTVPSPQGTESLSPGTEFPTTQGTQFPTPREQSSQLNKEKETTKQNLRNAQPCRASLCQQMNPGNHNNSCNAHPSNASEKARQAWEISARTAGTEWESMTEDQRQEYHRDRMDARSAKAAQTPEHEKEQQLQKLITQGGHGELSPGNRAWVLRSTESSMPQMLKRAFEFQLKGYEPMTDYPSNAYTDFMNGDLAHFRKINESERKQ